MRVVASILPLLATSLCPLCWSADESQEVRRPPITALAVTPDGTSVVVGSQAGIKVLSWPDLQPTAALETELVNVHDLAFSPDGTTLAAVGGTPARRGTVELYRWPERVLVRRWDPHRDLIYAVDWRSDSAVIATASSDRIVAIHETVSGKLVLKLEGHSRGVRAVRFLGNARLLSAGGDETLRLWDAKSGELLRTYPQHTRAVHGLALRPDHDGSTLPMVASVSDDRTVRLWQPTVGRMVRFAQLNAIPQAVAWTRDGSEVLVACKDGRLRVIDPETVELVGEQLAVEGVAYSLVVAPDGSALVGGQYGGLRRLTRNP